MDDRPPLKNWILPLMIVSLLVVVAGVFATYADTTQGAVVVLIGLCGVAVAAWGAGRSV